MRPILRPLALSLLLFSPPTGADAARPRQGIVCQLGVGTSNFDMRMNQPATSYAISELSTIYRLLCPHGCGQVALYQNATAPNALTAVVAPATSIIAYNPAFMNQVLHSVGPEASFGILAHEFGHHGDINFSPAWMNDSWSRELRADAWAGCALARRGFSSGQLEIALQAIAEYPSPSHPGWALRIPALRQGYVSCGGAPALLPW